MIDFQDAKQTAVMLAAVGEPTRLRILHQLLDGPAHVGRLAELVGMPIVNVSHHLGVMRQARLLDDVKVGRRVVYGLRPEVYAPGGGPGVVGTLHLGVYRVVLVHGASADGAADGRKPARKRARRAGGAAAGD